ncbi:multinuclear nonheme iron-dependent oxidase [Natronospora cellulosivora (SeqCode)]
MNQSDSRFLYDISHAYWSSVKRGESFENYVSKLPLDKVYEIHINGWEEKDGIIQGHTKIQDEGYDYLNDLLSTYPIEIVTLEYGRHYDKIDSGCPLVNIDKVNPDAKVEVEEQLLRLKEIIV